MTPMLGCKPDGLWDGNVMKVFIRNVTNFFAKHDGLTAVEYAVMLSLIILACIVPIIVLGKGANPPMTKVSDASGQSASPQNGTGTQSGSTNGNNGNNGNHGDGNNGNGKGN